MSISSPLASLFQHTADFLYSRLPQPAPDLEELKNCKLISHRGEHDNRRIFENTFAAFDAALNAGVWGIEFDIRWTKDLYPVVFHDEHCLRLFKSKTPINKLTLKELRKNYPLIPTLDEVIQRYGKKIHLMAEIKEEPWSDRLYQNQLLKELFSTFIPCADYHVLSLSLEMFDRIDFAPRHTLLPVAESNIRRLSAWALQQDCAGLAGHYLLLTTPTLKKLKEHGLKVATAYVASKNCLYRELNRGVDWIFTNRAVMLQAALEGLRGKQQGEPHF